MDNYIHNLAILGQEEKRSLLKDLLKEPSYSDHNYCVTAFGERASKNLPKAVEILPEYYRFDLDPKYLHLQQQIKIIEANGFVNPYFTIHEGLNNDTTIIDNREFINYSSTARRK